MYVPERHAANTFYSTCKDRYFPVIRSGRVKDVLTISEVRTQFPRYLLKSEHMPEGVNKCILLPCRIEKYFIVKYSVHFILNAYLNARMFLHTFMLPCFLYNQIQDASCTVVETT